MNVYIMMAWEEKFGRYGTPDFRDMGDTILDVFDTEEKAQEAMATIANDEKTLRDYLARSKKGVTNNMFTSLFNTPVQDTRNEHDKVIDALSKYRDVSVMKVLNNVDMTVTVVTKTIG